MVTGAEQSHMGAEQSHMGAEQSHVGAEQSHVVWHTPAVAPTWGVLLCRLGRHGYAGFGV